MISHQPQHYCWVKLPFLVTEIVWDAAADTWGAYETQCTGDAKPLGIHGFTQFMFLFLST